MKRSKKQMVIPAPGEGKRRDSTELSEELWFGLVATVLVIILGWYFWILPQGAQEEDPFKMIEDPVEREVARDRAEYDGLYASGLHITADWSEAGRRTRAFDAGSRQVTEFLCAREGERLKKGEMSEAEVEALVERVESRSADAPWTCLLRHYLRGELRDQALVDAMAGVWEEIRGFERLGRSLKETLEEYRVQRDRPESEEFYRWLRRCGMNFEYEAGPECRRLLRQLSPEQGADLLEMIFVHFRDQELTAGEVKEGARALARLSENGQPSSWKVLETRVLPDYNVDFRYGALFGLCRLMNSPDEAIQREVTELLGRVSGVSIRARNPYTIYRWRQTCRRAFGDKENPEQPVPLLGVLVSLDEEGERFREDYGMESVIERGHCSNPEGAPRWFCGAERWTGGGEPLHRVMARHFAQTAYVQWYELEELAEAMPPE